MEIVEGSVDQVTVLQARGRVDSTTAPRLAERLIRGFAFETVDGALQSSENPAMLCLHECPPDTHEPWTAPISRAKGAS